MKIPLNDKLIAWLALLSGLSISAVAIYYSVAGLISIFAAAVIPIAIMGIVLETGKLAATVWLKQNWSIAPRFLKVYLLIAITVLMAITSMGIFGYLSKAHLDQAVPTGEVAAKVSILDEKIRTERENIDAARRALKQMDEAVDQTMARSTTEQGAGRAAQLRRQQQAERTRLQKDISVAQSNISRLTEERAPIASELRKVEAEVGPIKYIAALIYGDNPDNNLLERAVRWMIIIIVLVFDPLAVILLLASQYSFAWFRKKEEEVEPVEEKVKEEPNLPEPEDTGYVPGPWPFKVQEKTEQDLVEEANEKLAEIEPEVDVDAIIESAEEVKAQEEHHDDKDDEEIINEAHNTMKLAMQKWKEDNPGSSLKLMKRLHASGKLDKLPWESYLEPKPDFDDEAAIEAAKWAQEQLEKAEPSKKKGNDLDGEGRQATGQENQGIVGYVQNAEQNEQTLWQRVQQAKK